MQPGGNRAPDPEFIVSSVDMGRGHFLSEAQFPTRRKGKSFTDLAEQPFLSQNSLPSVFSVQAEVKLVAILWLTQIVFNSLG